MSRVYVARHGQSTWNAEHRWAGHADPPLSELGRIQARKACEVLGAHSFDRVGSSNLVRAAETASIIASELGVPLLEPIGQLDERFAGPLSGLTSTEVETEYPGFLDRWRSGAVVEIPGGEPWTAFVDRVSKGLEQLKTFPDRILIVSHAGVLQAIEHRLGRPRSRHANLAGLWVPDL